MSKKDETSISRRFEQLFTKSVAEGGFFGQLGDEVDKDVTTAVEEFLKKIPLQKESEKNEN